MTRDQKALAAIIKDQMAHIDAATLRGATDNEIKIAKLIADRMAVKLALYLGTDNKNFSRETFLNECGVGA
jgi:hypothetical protein